MNNDIENVIMRILAGSEHVNDNKLFSEWYNLSEDNRVLFLSLKDIYDRRKGGIYPTNNEINAVWLKINNTVTEKAKRKKRQSTFAIISSVAAIAIVIVVLCIAFVKNNDVAVDWVEVKTNPRSAPKTILLSDGSEVIVNASSYLKYPRNFTAGKREIYLDGEAFFKVSKADNSEFVVHTEKQSINVLGTEFNVLAYSSDNSTITTLVNGKIKLETYGNDNTLIDEIIVLPNQQINFDRSINEATVSDIDISDAMMWIDGVYSFREASLCEITRRLGYVTGVTFILDEELIDEEYTGKFFYYQTPEEIIEVLNFKGEYQHKITNDTILLF